MPDPVTMTIEEVCEWLAVDTGEWNRKSGGRWYHKRWHKLGSGQKRHPVPASLDAFARLWPEGWTWTRDFNTNRPDPEVGMVLCWTAFDHATERGDVWIRDTGDELLDRGRLLVAVRMAGKGGGCGE